MFSSRRHFNLWEGKQGEEPPKNPRIQGDPGGKWKVSALEMQAAGLFTQCWAPVEGEGTSRFSSYFLSPFPPSQWELTYFLWL